MRRLVPTERFVSGVRLRVSSTATTATSTKCRLAHINRDAASSPTLPLHMCVCLWQRTSADEVEANDPPLQMSRKHLQTGRTWDLQKTKNLLLWLKGTCVTVRTALIIINYETDRPTTSVFSPIHSQGGVQLPQQVLALVYVATLR